MTDLKAKQIQKYLANYAEPEVQAFDTSLVSQSDAVIVLPVFKEKSEFLSRLLTTRFAGINSFLIILVSNHPDDLKAEEKRIAVNAHKQLKSVLPAPYSEAKNLRFYKHDNVMVILVDRTESQSIPSEQGVGLARKIGADIALKLILEEKILKPWIFNTDADAHLPMEYFSSVEAIGEASAICYPFQHSCNDGNLAVDAATRLYERKLHQYVIGLQEAGSPYAFHTIGSTIAISANAYAAVRGFPKRAAGEDFYLLNKAAKLGSVVSLNSPTIEIEARSSDRIPFGTGPFVSKIMDAEEIGSERVFYHPEVFDLLAEFLQTFRENLPEDDTETLGISLRGAAEQVGLPTFIEHARKQNLVGKQYQHHFNVWFDAFKTLKFIHALRDTNYPNVSAKELDQLSNQVK